MFDLINKTIETIKNAARTPAQMITAVQKASEVSSVLLDEADACEGLLVETEVVTSALVGAGVCVCGIVGTSADGVTCADCVAGCVGASVGVGVGGSVGVGVGVGVAGLFTVILM